MKRDELLDEIKKLSRKIYLQKDKDYFEIRIRNILETYAMSLELKKVLITEED